MGYEAVAVRNGGGFLLRLSVAILVMHGFLVLLFVLSDNWSDLQSLWNTFWLCSN